MEQEFVVPKPMEYWIQKGLRTIKRKSGRQVVIKVWGRRDSPIPVELDDKGHVKPIRYHTRNEAIRDSARAGMVAVFV